jgi:hypothetical protein
MASMEDNALRALPSKERTSDAWTGRESRAAHPGRAHRHCPGGGRADGGPTRGVANRPQSGPP